MPEGAAGETDAVEAEDEDEEELDAVEAEDEDEEELEDVEAEDEDDAADEADDDDDEEECPGAHVVVLIVSIILNASVSASLPRDRYASCSDRSRSSNQARTCAAISCSSIWAKASGFSSTISLR